MAETTNKTKYVVVTTEHKGVFGGYLTKQSGTTVTLRDARMCVYYSADMKSVMGLASIGPSSTCRISPAVPSIDLYDVTAIMDVASGVRERWEAAPWK